MMWEDKCTRLEEQATREATRRGVVRVWVTRERDALGWVIVTPDVPMDRVCRAMPPGTKEGACTRACVAVWALVSLRRCWERITIVLYDVGDNLDFKISKIYLLRI